MGGGGGPPSPGKSSSSVFCQYDPLCFFIKKYKSEGGVFLFSFKYYELLFLKEFLFVVFASIFGNLPLSFLRINRFFFNIEGWGGGVLN